MAIRRPSVGGSAGCLARPVFRSAGGGADGQIDVDNQGGSQVLARHFGEPGCGCGRFRKENACILKVLAVLYRGCIRPPADEDGAVVRLGEAASSDLSDTFLILCVGREVWLRASGSGPSYREEAGCK